jgi:hypothetical protein
VDRDPGAPGRRVLGQPVEGFRELDEQDPQTFLDSGEVFRGDDLAGCPKMPLRERAVELRD